MAVEGWEFEIAEYEAGYTHQYGFGTRVVQDMKDTMRACVWKRKRRKRKRQKKTRKKKQGSRRQCQGFGYSN
jgi:hypothetical protein